MCDWFQTRTYFVCSLCCLSLGEAAPTISHRPTCQELKISRWSERVSQSGQEASRHFYPRPRQSTELPACSNNLVSGQACHLKRRAIIKPISRTVSGEACTQCSKATRAAIHAACSPKYIGQKSDTGHVRRRCARTESTWGSSTYDVHRERWPKGR